NSHALAWNAQRRMCAHRDGSRAMPPMWPMWRAALRHAAAAGRDRDDAVLLLVAAGRPRVLGQERRPAEPEVALGGLRVELHRIEVAAPVVQGAIGRREEHVHD